MNLNVNYGLWVNMTYQHRFIDCNKCATLVEDIDNVEVMYVRGQRVHRKSLYVLLNFSVNLKQKINLKSYLKNNNKSEK